MISPYMTVYLVTSLPKIPYTHCIYMVAANPIFNQCLVLLSLSMAKTGLSHKCFTTHVYLCAGQVQYKAYELTTFVGLARTIYIRCVYGILAGKSPDIWSYTVYIYGSGQPYTFGCKL
jgi:hypothetical protein